ncbi:MAG: hypothetical protein K6G90_01285 [Clostridia bacterium]|nr:hypothetical protein [Clostridia bacterium]
MWDFICEQNWNLLLIGAGILIADVIAVAALWKPAEWLRDRFYDWLNAGRAPEPDCTVTETGVGVIEPWQITHDRDEWAELLKVFDFGERGYGE